METLAFTPERPNILPSKAAAIWRFLLKVLAHEPQGRCRIALGLGQQVQDLALTIDSPPQVHAPALD